MASKEELDEKHPSGECPKCHHWNTLHVRHPKLRPRDFLCVVEDCGCIQTRRLTVRDVRQNVLGFFVFLFLMSVFALIVGGSVSYFVNVHVPALRHLWH